MYGSKIMIVEDEGAFTLEIQKRLEQFGYIVSAVRFDRMGIVEKAGEFQPDLILMDIHHEICIDGIAVAQEIHKLFGAPIIFLTAFDNGEILHRSFQTRTSGFLLEPIDDHDLYANIELALSRALFERAVNDRELSFQALIENSTDIFSLIDANGTIHYSSPSTQAILEYSADEITGRSLFSLIHPDDREQAATIIKKSLINNQNFSNIRFRVCSKNGSWKVIESHASLVINNPQIQGIVINLRDITERADMEQTIRTERDQTKRILDSAPVLLLTLDDHGFITMINSFAQRLLGYEEKELLGKNWFDLCLPDELRDEMRKLHMQAVRGDIALPPENRYVVRTKTGETRFISWHNMALSRTGQRINAVLFSGEDITEWKLAEERLYFNAEHDSLTGLPNRIAFLTCLEEAIERAEKNHRYRFAVLYLDLDSFKLINDSLGHTFGDRYLVATARRLETILRHTDVIARFSGDEFHILIDQVCSPADMTDLAERIQKELNTPILIDGQNIGTSCSIGIVIGSRQTKYIDEILRDADIAMYQAKARGKAGYSFYVPSMSTLPKARLKLENDLRQALERNEFRLVYQPLISLTDQRCSGFEALLRWKCPDGCEITPTQFIPVLEETGLIIQVGEWVLQQACKQIKTWQEEDNLDEDITVSVNISVRQLTFPTFVEQVINTVRRAGIRPQNLILELTESILLMDTEFARTLLLRLRDVGIRTHIDDFGTGYSSLRYLQTLPFDAIKIDRSFIQDLESGIKRKEIIHSIIELGKMVGVNTVAEGVETDEQFNSLIRNGCTHAQGYLISKPMASEKVPEWIRQRQDSTPYFLPISNPTNIQVNL